jgi:chemotaxis receptor (MCP) glutamine deamidase CheD
MLYNGSPLFHIDGEGRETMAPIIETPGPPDAVTVVLTFIVELIQILIDKGVVNKADARKMLAGIAEKMRTDAVAIGERNADAVRNIAEKYFK